MRPRPPGVRWGAFCVRAGWLALSLALAAASAIAAAAEEAPFPRPEELRPAVEFWKRVFTLYGTDQGILHDDTFLEVVYGVESLGARADTGQDVQRRQSQEAILDRYRQALEGLAVGVGDTSALTPEARRVRQALGPAATPIACRQAAERLRLQVGQRDRFERGWAVFSRHGERVARILRSHGVPDSLAVLPFVESMYNARARSHAAAVGLWQITRPAGRRFLRIDAHVDERLDPVKATAAAAQILSHNRQVLGNWPLAITAYNHGTAGVARAVRETGSRDIAVLVRAYRGPAFGFASRNFYAEYLAALEVVVQRTRGHRRPAPGPETIPDEWAQLDSAAGSPGAAPPAAAVPQGGAELTLARADRFAAAPDTAARPDSAMVPAAVDARDHPGRASALSAGRWWDLACLVLAPARLLEADHLRLWVALFTWVEDGRRAWAAVFGAPAG